MSMSRQINKCTEQAGMTLVEILVSLVILGLVLTAIFPLVTNSMQVTNLTNSITLRLLGAKEDIEIVAVTKDGAYLEDGTFIPKSYFPVVSKDGTTWVPGMTIKKDDLIRFSAFNLGSHYELFEVYEGYTEEEAQLTIQDRSFNQDSDFVMVDKDGNEINLDISITDGQSITFSLPTNSNRLTNLQSPYQITITTDDSKISAMLLVHLPRAVIVDNRGNLLISSSPHPGNWINKSSSISSSDQINKICFVGKSEQTARYIAVGNRGSIYLWENGEQVFKKLSPSGVGSTDLNDILATEDGLLVVGDNGLILHSLDGTTWTVRRSSSSSQPDLYSITYFEEKNEYVCTGANGSVLISTNGQSWTERAIPGQPQLVNNGIYDKKAVSFSSPECYLKTVNSGVQDDGSRTILMVVKPSQAPTNVHLLTMGSSNQYFSLRTNNNGKLLVVTNSFNQESNFVLERDKASIICCRYDKGSRTLSLSKDGSTYQSFGNITINTGSQTNPVYLGSNLLLNYDNPLYYNGMIAEVFVFSKVLSTERPGRPWPLSGNYASESDIANKYLSLKYNISLQDSSINNTYYRHNLLSADQLSSLNWSNWQNKDCWPFTATPTYHSGLNRGVLWLNATNLNTGSEQVRVWADSSGNNNHAAVAALYAAASTGKGHLYAGGYHRHMVHYESNGNLSMDNESLNNQLGQPIQYSIDDMVYTSDRFIVLLNDNLKTGEAVKSYIAAIDNRPGSSSNLRVASDYQLNDICYYSAATTVFVVGNNGSIFYSENDGANWHEDDSVTTSYNLMAICLR